MDGIMDFETPITASKDGFVFVKGGLMQGKDDPIIDALIKISRVDYRTIFESYCDRLSDYHDSVRSFAGQSGVIWLDDLEDTGQVSDLPDSSKELDENDELPIKPYKVLLYGNNASYTVDVEHG